MSHFAQCFKTWDKRAKLICNFMILHQIKQRNVPKTISVEITQYKFINTPTSTKLSTDSTTLWFIWYITYVRSLLIQESCENELLTQKLEHSLTSLSLSHKGDSFAAIVSLQPTIQSTNKSWNFFVLGYHWWNRLATERLLLRSCEM